MELMHLYYFAKPAIPPRLRWTLRRIHARMVRRLSGSEWPIREGAKRKPAGWKGWPGGKDFAFVLTHDVESGRGLDRVSRLAELEMEAGFRSSFNFIPERDYRVPGELRSWLGEHGFEVGVHGLKHDGKLYLSRRVFRERAKRINEYLREWDAVGFRSPFMHHNLDWMHEIDLRYDSSTFDTDPFEPQPDGCESIFPFLVRRGADGSTSSYVELPYTLPQDSTLFLLLGETTTDVWKRKLDWVAENGGLAMLIVHPDYVRFGGDGNTADSFPDSLYRDFLKYVKENYEGRYWHALPREVADWFGEVNGKTGEEPAMVKTVESEKQGEKNAILKGRRVASVVLSDYPNDPRPRREAETLVQEGMEVEVICAKRNPEDPGRLNLNGVDVLRLPMKHRRAGKLVYAMQYFGFLAAAFGVLAFRSMKGRYALVHVHNMPDILVFSALVPKLLGARVVLDLHDPMPELMRTIYGIPEDSRSVKLLRFFEKISLGFADGIITVSETFKSIFASRSAPAEKITVVMNTPDAEMFELRAAEPPAKRGEGEPFVVMYHGSLVERNGLALAVDAMEKLHADHRDVELHVYGHRTPFLDDVLASVEERGIRDAVKYRGARRIEEIVNAIDTCDLGIVPNLKNSFTEINTPTRILEFLVRGKPVIAPASKGVLEFFDERQLITFELGSAEDLARKIEYSVANPEEVFEITVRGQEVCRARCWDRERDKLIDRVTNLLGARA